MTRKRKSALPRRSADADLSARQRWHLQTGHDSAVVEGAPWATRRDYERANRRYDAGNLTVSGVGRRCHDQEKLRPTPRWLKEGNRNE
jgi:hypothetical protein